MNARKIMLLAVAMTAVCGILLFASSTGKQDPSGAIALKAQLTALEQRVSILEARFELVLPASTIDPPMFPHMQKLPENWEMKVFNGLPYYIVPIQTTPSKAIQAK